VQISGTTWVWNDKPWRGHRRMVTIGWPKCAEILVFIFPLRHPINL